MTLVQLLFVNLFGLFNWLLIQKGLSCILNALDLGWNTYTAHYFHVTGVVTIATGVLTQVVGQV